MVNNLVKGSAYMSVDQMGFDLGVPETPRPSRKAAERFMGDNLFIAARPDRAVAAAAQSIARDYRELYRIDRQPLSDRRLHVNLVGLEGAPVLEQRLIHDARVAIDNMRFEPFDIIFDSVVSLRNRSGRPIALASTLPNAALGAVTARLADRLDGLGALPPGFNGNVLFHMTLIHYDKPVMPEHLSKPIRFAVDRLWLGRSLIGQGHHEFLWPPERHADA
jgi:2'-5' RNA ligase